MGTNWLAVLVVCCYLFSQARTQTYLNMYNPIPIESDSRCEDARYQDKCYYFGMSVEWWIGASEQCKKIGYQLARIRNTDEANYLAKHLKNTGFRYFWVDAADEYHEGLWLTADQKPAFIGYFAPGEPNGERFENCGELQISDNGLGRLNDMDCRQWRKYICERKTTMVCPRAGYQERCYWFSLHPANWYQAREHCQSLGMRLARVGGAETSNFIAQHQTSESSWIDVRYGSANSGFTYNDGAQFSSNWLYNSGLQPNGGTYLQKCGEVRPWGTSEGRISGVDCMAMRHFVCERQPMSTDSAGTDNDQLLGLPSGLGGSSASGGRRRRDTRDNTFDGEKNGDSPAVSQWLSLFNRAMTYKKPSSPSVVETTDESNGDYNKTAAGAAVISSRFLRGRRSSGLKKADDDKMSLYDLILNEITEKKPRRVHHKKPRHHDKKHRHHGKKYHHHDKKHRHHLRPRQRRMTIYRSTVVTVIDNPADDNDSQYSD